MEIFIVIILPSLVASTNQTILTNSEKSLAIFSLILLFYSSITSTGLLLLLVISLFLLLTIVNINQFQVVKSRPLLLEEKSKTFTTGSNWILEQRLYNRLRLDIGVVRSLQKQSKSATPPFLFFRSQHLFFLLNVVFSSLLVLR